MLTERVGLGHSVTECPFFLSPKQKEVLSLAAQGLTDAAIARQLGRSPRTVRAHLQAARARLNATNTTHAVALAISSGLIHFKGMTRRTRGVKGGVISGPDGSPVRVRWGLWLKLRRFDGYYRLAWIYGDVAWLAKENTTRYPERYGPGGAVAAMQDLAESVGAFFSDEVIGPHPVGDGDQKMPEKRDFLAFGGG